MKSCNIGDDAPSEKFPGSLSLFTRGGRFGGDGGCSGQITVVVILCSLHGGSRGMFCRSVQNFDLPARKQVGI